MFKQRIPLGEETLHSLLFADDQMIFAYMIFAESNDSYMTQKYDKLGLKINLKRRVHMHWKGGKRSNFGKYQIKWCDKFKRLRSVIGKRSTCDEDSRLG